MSSVTKISALAASLAAAALLTSAPSHAAGAQAGAKEKCYGGRIPGQWGGVKAGH